MSPAQGYRRFLLFFYTAKAGDKLRIYLAFAAKGPGCVLMGRVVHAPFLGRDLARLTLRFGAERMGRAGGGFNGRGCACTLLPGVWFGLLCAFGSNALGWPVAFQWAGVAGIGKGYFSSSAAGEQNSPPQGFPEHAFFSITIGLLFPCLFPAFCKKQTQTPKPKRKYLCFSGWLIAF